MQTLKVLKNAKRWLSVFWFCKVWNYHTWTNAHDRGIKPTDEQLKSGVLGFWEYAKMYCDRCGHVSELSQKEICKYKN